MSQRTVFSMHCSTACKELMCIWLHNENDFQS